MLKSKVSTKLEHIDSKQKSSHAELESVVTAKQDSAEHQRQHLDDWTTGVDLELNTRVKDVEKFLLYELLKDKPTGQLFTIRILSITKINVEVISVSLFN